MRLLDYSPNEKYLMTYSSQEPTHPKENVKVCFIIFDTRTARKLRVFEGPADEYAVGTSSTGVMFAIVLLRGPFH
jgi:translation initiation factor 3 subunit B